MSLQFSRSLRSLRIDSFQASRIGLLLAILNVVALLVWFFFGKVTLYEVSSGVEFTSDGRVLAVFSEEGAKRIREGQSAIVRIEGQADQPSVTLPALVIDTSGKEKVEVLIISTDAPAETGFENLKGQVDIEVEYVTPAEMVFRTSGKYLNQSQIPVSPQLNKGFQEK